MSGHLEKEHSLPQVYDGLPYGSGNEHLQRIDIVTCGIAEDPLRSD